MSCGPWTVAARQRGEQVRLAGIDVDQVADREPAFAAQFGAQRRDEGDAAGAGDLIVEVVVVEGRDRDAGDAPDIVEIHLRGQDIDQGLGGAGLVHRNDDFVLGFCRYVMLWAAGRWIARDGEGVLMGGDGGEAGEEGRADGQQPAIGEQARARIRGGFEPAAGGQRRAFAVEEVADAAFAAFRIGGGLGEAFCLVGEAGVQPFAPAEGHRLRRALRGRGAAGVLGLAQQAFNFRAFEG